MLYQHVGVPIKRDIDDAVNLSIDDAVNLGDGFFSQFLCDSRNQW
jgi:hypothetical protein